MLKWSAISGEYFFSKILFLKNIPYAMGDCQEGESRFSLLAEGFGFPKTLVRTGKEFEGVFAKNSWQRHKNLVFPKGSVYHARLCKIPSQYQ